VSVTYSEDNGRFTVGSEKTIFRLQSFPLAGVSPDGHRFLLTRLAQPEPMPGIRVVVNWLES
jgi:hypothetical protein